MKRKTLVWLLLLIRDIWRDNSSKSIHHILVNLVKIRSIGDGNTSRSRPNFSVGFQSENMIKEKLTIIFLNIFSYPCWNLIGFGSISSPVQLYFSSNNKVFVPSKKSSAPASIKNPSLTCPWKTILSRNLSCSNCDCLLWKGTYLSGETEN